MKRRNVLKATGTSIAAGALFGSQASAEVSGADDPELVRSKMEADDDLLGELSAEGYLDDATLEAVDFDGAETKPLWFHGSRIDVVTVSKSLDDGELTLNLVPATDDVFAVATDGEVTDTYGTLGHCPGEDRCFDLECECVEYDYHGEVCVRYSCSCEPTCATLCPC